LNKQFRETSTPRQANIGRQTNNLNLDFNERNDQELMLDTNL